LVYAFGALYQKDMKLRQRWLHYHRRIVTCFSSSLEPSTSTANRCTGEDNGNVNIHVLSFINTTKYSAVAGLFVDDDWAAILSLALFEMRADRIREDQYSVILRHLRPGADVLLHPAMVHGAHDRSSAPPDLWQACTLLSNADRLVHSSSGRHDSI